jgi:ketol-acid reductoisomerase
MVSGPRVVDENSRKQMQAVLQDIQDGTFARNWIAENEAGMPEFKRMMQADLEHPIEKVGAELRSRMDWLEE